MKIEAIVPAAGRGLRLKTDIGKPFVKIGNTPILIYTLKALAKTSLINDIIVVVESKKIKATKKIIKKYKLKKIKAVVAGGLQRSSSVRNGLEFVDKTTDFVLIHDGVRPFVNKDIISAVIKKAYKTGVAIVGVPVKPTLKQVEYKKSLIVKKTVKRDNIWEVQTPQVFKRALIFKVYKNLRNKKVTDDASLVEGMGIKIPVVRGSYFNIKITTPEDLIFAGAIVR